MSDRDEILFVNEAFYICFSTGDFEGMQDLWALTAPVTCIHPGWELIKGRDTVVSSWNNIIQAGAPDICCFGPEVQIYGNTATVLCYEMVKGGYLVATNIFIRENGTWKIVHHQAGPTSGKPQENNLADKETSIN